jgi:integrase/recombinase XerD
MSNILPGLIERFFTQRLMRQRNASSHTVAAYRDTFRLLLKFAHARTGKRPSALDLGDLDADLIVAFLDHLADDRAASPATYNLRLTAIRAFFRFLAFEEPAYSGQIQRVLAYPVSSPQSARSRTSCETRSGRSSRRRSEPPGSAGAITLCCS